MKDAILKFLRDEQGATAIEYGLLAGLIAAAIVAGITSVGGNLQLLFNYISTKIPTT